jgi:hypothetical protein
VLDSDGRVVERESDGVPGVGMELFELKLGRRRREAWRIVDERESGS